MTVGHYGGLCLCDATRPVVWNIYAKDFQPKGIHSLTKIPASPLKAKLGSTAGVKLDVVVS